MAVFIKEDSAEKLSKEVHLPPKLTNLMIKKSNYYGEIDPKLKGYKRAKKIASAAEKEEYNTQKGKFKPSESGVTLNYNEIKRWTNALKQLPKNSDAFDANGGEEAKMLVNDLMKQVRRNNHKVEMIPPVEKLVKDTKVSDSKLKPTKLGSSDVYMESVRKVYINENQLLKLRENIEEITPQMLLNTLYKEYRCKPPLSTNMTADEFNNMFQNILNDPDIVGEFKDTLNQDFYNTINNNLDKIYIEREFKISSIFDLYSYDGIGTSWSWENGGAEAYFGNGDIDITLQGFTNADNVDWEKTIFLNSYPLQEQKEIRVKTNTPILLTSFIFNGKKYNLKKPLPLNSGSIDIGII